MTGGVSRRELLAGIGMAGAAIGSSAVGHSTASAFLSDAEGLAGNVTTSGEVDLDIAYTASYNGSEDDFDVSEIVPGDEGQFEFTPTVTGSPAYLWLGGGVTRSDEKGMGESEGETVNGDPNPPDGPGGELEDAMMAELMYASDGSESTIRSERTFGELCGELRHGVPLSADPGRTTPGEQVCFDGSEDVRIVLRWRVPELSAGNSSNISTDELEFEFVFHAQQCRHNDGMQNPCPAGIGSVSFGVEGSETPSDTAVSTLTVTERNAGGGPVALEFEWASDVTLQTVVLDYEGIYENFYVDGSTSGTVEAVVGSGDERLHYESENSAARENNQTPSDPYPGDQTGITYTYQGGEFILDS
jgi:hypothetical protein